LHDHDRSGRQSLTWRRVARMRVCHVEGKLPHFIVRKRRK
jgi:hypothetical protein